MTIEEAWGKLLAANEKKKKLIMYLDSLPYQDGMTAEEVKVHQRWNSTPEAKPLKLRIQFCRWQIRGFKTERKRQEEFAARDNAHVAKFEAEKSLYKAIRKVDKKATVEWHFSKRKGKCYCIVRAKDGSVYRKLRGYKA